MTAAATTSANSGQGSNACGGAIDDLAAVAGHRAPRGGCRRHRRLQPVPRQDDRRLLRRNAAPTGGGVGARGGADHLDPRHRGDRHRQRPARRRPRRRGRRHRRGDPLQGQRPGGCRCAADADRRPDRSGRPGGGAGVAGAEPGDAAARREPARARRYPDLRARHRPRRRHQRPGHRGPADRGDGAEGADRTVRRDHRHPAGRGRRLRDARHGLRDAAGHRHAARRLLGPRAAESG